jgi:hypothetical protein
MASHVLINIYSYRTNFRILTKLKEKLYMYSILTSNSRLEARVIVTRHFRHDVVSSHILVIIWGIWSSHKCTIQDKSISLTSVRKYTPITSCRFRLTRAENLSTCMWIKSVIIFWAFFIVWNALWPNIGDLLLYLNWEIKAHL